MADGKLAVIAGLAGIAGALILWRRRRSKQIDLEAAATAHSRPRWPVPRALTEFLVQRRAESSESKEQFIFDSYQKGGLLYKQGFIDACCRDLKLGLDEPELERVFSTMMDVRADSENNEVGMDVNEFKRALRERFFIRNIVPLPIRQKSKVLPATFDVSKSTKDNYTGDGDQFSIGGQFASIRQRRDHAYHGFYAKERQAWQDAVIGTVCQRTTPQPKPWLVFTCGAMGAGKGYALGWMSREGYFPLEQIVHIDPDHFKQVMPEWDEYVRHSREIGRPTHAGNMCHRESCYLQEIAAEVAMQKEQNVWIDGSLRDHVWFSSVFDDIRARHPSYRIAIVVVQVAPETVRQRVAARAAATGRDIPEQQLQQSLDAVEASISKLGPKADLVARIDNSELVPRLGLVSINDFSGAWAQLGQRFARTTPAPKDFPTSLAPLFVARAEGVTMIAHKGPLVLFGHAAHRMVLEMSGMRHTVITSPAVPVTLDAEAREMALIPMKAMCFVWINPTAGGADPSWRLRRSDASLAERSLFEVGGFAYFDEDSQLLAINALTPEKQPHMLQFGQMQAWTASRCSCLASCRWAEVTVPHMIERGASKFCWVPPTERLEGRFLTWREPAWTAPMGGGFAYQLKACQADGTPIKHRYVFFPVLTAHVD